MIGLIAPVRTLLVTFLFGNSTVFALRQTTSGGSRLSAPSRGTKLKRAPLPIRMDIAAAGNVVKLPDLRSIESVEGNDNVDRNIYHHIITEAVLALKQGKLLALPTDTIYGIACLAQNPTAVNRIYELKGRDPAKPIAICVSSGDQINKWAKSDTIPEELVDELLPGPVTLVFERTEHLNPKLNPDTNLIGVRIPDNKFVNALCDACGEPLALTSANKSGGQSPLRISEFEELWSELAMVIDAGALNQNDEDVKRARLGSTVVNVSVRGVYGIVRDGSALAETRGLLELYGLRSHTT